MERVDTRVGKRITVLVEALFWVTWVSDEDLIDTSAMPNFHLRLAFTRTDAIDQETCFGDFESRQLVHVESADPSFRWVIKGS